MQLARPILLALLAVGLATYSLDCGATMTPEEAMQCCNSMPCSSHGHGGQDCCKTMPSMHAPFVQPPTAHNIGLASISLTTLTATKESPSPSSSARRTAARCHAPPI